MCMIGGKGSSFTPQKTSRANRIGRLCRLRVVRFTFVQELVGTEQQHTDGVGTYPKHGGCSVDTTATSDEQGTKLSHTFGRGLPGRDLFRMLVVLTEIFFAIHTTTP